MKPISQLIMQDSASLYDNAKHARLMHHNHDPFLGREDLLIGDVKIYKERSGALAWAFSLPIRVSCARFMFLNPA